VNKEARYISLDEVVALHHNLVQKYGGSHGIRDFDLLISAVSRPQASFGGEDLYKNIFSKASALLHSLVLNHPFIDGNKRTGSASCIRFLYLNGYVLKVGNEELVQFVLEVANKKVDLDEIAAWLKKHSQRRR
jgi:death-on-curing protein